MARRRDFAAAEAATAAGTGNAAARERIGRGPAATAAMPIDAVAPPPYGPPP